MLVEEADIETGCVVPLLKVTGGYMQSEAPRQTHRNRLWSSHFHVKYVLHVSRRKSGKEMRNYSDLFGSEMGRCSAPKQQRQASECQELLANNQEALLDAFRTSLARRAALSWTIAVRLSLRGGTKEGGMTYTIQQVSIEKGPRKLRLAGAETPAHRKEAVACAMPQCY